MKKLYHGLLYNLTCTRLRFFLKFMPGYVKHVAGRWTWESFREEKLVSRYWTFVQTSWLWKCSSLFKGENFLIISLTLILFKPFFHWTDIALGSIEECCRLLPPCVSSDEGYNLGLPWAIWSTSSSRFIGWEHCNNASAGIFNFPLLSHSSC